MRRWERLPSKAADELRLPELGLMLATDLAVLDHADGAVLLIANAINYDATDERVDEAWADAVARLDAHDVRPGRARRIHGRGRRRRRATPTYASRTERRGLPGRGGARQGGDPRRGDVPGRGQPALRVDVPADALDVYRVLRATNPSPYMYLLRFEGFDIVGSSPEALVKVADGRAMAHPIAGTRWRGATPEEDAALAAELLADEKERAEHLMLVDLARNDLGRVCAPGTVEVVDFMSVERYSHVMHIVSTVVGELAEGGRRTTCWPPPSRPARCRARRRCARWRSSTSSSRLGAACTAGPSATSTSPATWTWRSRSAPRLLRDGAGLRPGRRGHRRRLRPRGASTPSR